MCDMSRFRDMPHPYVLHDPFICASWILHIYNATWRIDTCHITNSYAHTMNQSYVYRDSLICVTGLIHMCAMTRSFVHYDSFIYAMWLIHMCDMNHSYSWREEICICDMIHSYMHHDSLIRVFTYATWHTYMRLMHMCDMTYAYVWHDLCICVTWHIQL